MPDVTTLDAPDAEAAAVADDMLYEVIDGRVVEKPPMGAFQNWIAVWLQHSLNSSPQVRGIGFAYPEMLFLLDPARKLKRRPDVAFVSFERWPADRPASMEEAWDVIPDLAIEIVSKSNTASEMVLKVRDYFGSGVRQVWIVYPVEQMVYVYRSVAEVSILQLGQDLDGGDVLPGFRISVANLLKIKAADDPSPAVG